MRVSTKSGRCTSRCGSSSPTMEETASSGSGMKESGAGGHLTRFFGEVCRDIAS